MSGTQPRSVPRSHYAHRSGRPRHFLHAQSRRSRVEQDEDGAAPAAAGPALPPISSCTGARESTAMPIRTAGRKCSTLASAAAPLIVLQVHCAHFPWLFAPCLPPCLRCSAEHAPRRPCHGAARVAFEPLTLHRSSLQLSWLALTKPRSTHHPLPLQQCAQAIISTGLDNLLELHSPSKRPSQPHGVRIFTVSRATQNTAATSTARFASSSYSTTTNNSTAASPAATNTSSSSTTTTTTSSSTSSATYLLITPIRQRPSAAAATISPPSPRSREFPIDYRSFGPKST